MKRLRITGGTVVTLGPDNRVLPGHDVLVEGDRITAIEPSKQRTSAGETPIDARGKVILPGFINAHMHFYSTFVRGLGKAAPSKNFVEVLRNLWWRLDRKLSLEDCRYSALVAGIDAIRHGTTTLIDHHASPGAVRGSLDAVASAVGEAGLRASLCYEVSDRDGAAVAEDGLAENAAFLDRVADAPDGRLHGLFGLHAAFTVGDKTLDKAVELARSRGAGFHIHVAEDLADQQHSQETHGLRVVERLRRHGVLGPSTICAHCVHVDGAEMDALVATDTMVVHNPQSNMNNAVGVADLFALLGKGVLCGLGTDAMTTNMLEEVRSALWLHHLNCKNPSVGFVEVLSLLLRNNQRITDRLFPGQLGELAVGRKADLVLIDYVPPTEFSGNTFLGHVAFGLSQAAVDTTIVDGEVLMQGKRLLHLDEERIAARARELSAALWERF